MPFFLIAVVMLFSIAIFVYALPVLLYIAPLVVIGVMISLIVDAVHQHHHSRPVGH